MRGGDRLLGFCVNVPDQNGLFVGYGDDFSLQLGVDEVIHQSLAPLGHKIDDKGCQGEVADTVRGVVVTGNPDLPPF